MKCDDPFAVKSHINLANKRHRLFLWLMERRRITRFYEFIETGPTLVPRYPPLTGKIAGRAAGMRHEVLLFIGRR